MAMSYASADTRGESQVLEIFSKVENM